MAQAMPLTVLVLGDGLDALIASLALHKQRHNVIIFRTAEAKQPNGIVHLTPNVNGVLERLGIFANEIGASNIDKVNIYQDRGRQIHSIEHHESWNTLWQFPWQIVERKALLNKLRSTLEIIGSTGPCFVTEGGVESIDAENGIVTMNSGKMYFGDLIIGADGLWSATRSMAQLGGLEPIRTPLNTVTVSIPRENWPNGEEILSLDEQQGLLNRWVEEDRIILSCRGPRDDSFHFFIIHRETQSKELEENDKEATLRHALGASFPAAERLFSCIDSDKIEIENVFDLQDPRAWTRGRYVLLGNSAHTVPLGLDDGMSIEDAISLAAVLPNCSPPEEIPARLRVYEEIRMARICKVQHLSCLPGQNLTTGNREGKTDPEVFEETLQLIFSHDEWHYSTHQLRRWDRNRNPHLYWRMPLSFGPIPGPRQTFSGQPHPSSHSTFHAATIRFRTSRTLLDGFLPSSSFEFISPGTIAEASITCNTLNRMDWLGGGGYDMLGLTVHGVQYTKQDGSRLRGSFLVVLFENLADPILSGREELGFPKLFCDIDISKNESSMRVKLGWRGNEFAQLFWEDLHHQVAQEHSVASTVEKGSETADQGLFVYRYVPAVGDRGKADAEYTVLVPPPPDGLDKPEIKRITNAKSAGVTFAPLSWKQLPTLHHVVSSLAEMPILEVLEAKVVEGSGVDDLSGALRLE